jgi:iron-sulfur cluster repair protein YtfE (RIC family)
MTPTQPVIILTTTKGVTVTTTATEQFRAHHKHLLEHVEHLRTAAREIPRLSPQERTLLKTRILDFLEGELGPHAAAEERRLYPEVARLLGHHEATATMSYDHLAIRGRTRELAETPVEATDRLQELLYGLFALIETHFRKEEDIYVPFLQREGADLDRALSDV